MLNNSPKGWKIKSTNSRFSNNMINVFEDILDLNGFEKIYTRCIRHNYSTIVPFISNDEILIINSYRHLVDSIQVEVPSGYIEENETPIQAAGRELSEETGYVAKTIIEIGNYTLDYSMFEQIGHIFVGYHLKDMGLKKLETMEKIEKDIKSIKEVKKLLKEGNILNAASIVALYRAIEYHENRI